MKSLRITLGLAALSSALFAFWPSTPSTAGTLESAYGSTAPDFTGATRWYNSAPLTPQALHGKVVLVEFWTRECFNCLNVVPHTRELYEKYAKDGLVVIGVHTPEYDEERDPALLQSAIHQLQITWPVAMDNDYRIWNAYGNRYWPAAYLIDQNGQVVYSHIGEGNYGETEKRIRQLLGKA